MKNYKSVYGMKCWCREYIGIQNKDWQWYDFEQENTEFEYSTTLRTSDGPWPTYRRFAFKNIDDNVLFIMRWR